MLLCSRFCFYRKNDDPLWHCHHLMHKFCNNAFNIVVPTGTAALDKSTAGTKARSKVSTYISSKTDCYSIKFYSFVGSTLGAYHHLILNNKIENTTSISPVKKIFHLFPAMQCSTKIFEEQRVI